MFLEISKTVLCKYRNEAEKWAENVGGDQDHQRPLRPSNQFPERFVRMDITTNLQRK